MFYNGLQINFTVSVWKEIILELFELLRDKIIDALNYF